MSASLLREAAAAIRADATSLDTDTSWHPAVALAVADWLDVVARRWPSGRSSVTRERASALAVATAYLGTT